jgi:RNA polymerase sigma-70 factor, ECF subfamily
LKQLSPVEIALAQSGDRAALNSILMQLQEPLYHHVVSVLRTESGADDVLQNVLLIIARKIGSVRDARWVRAWSYRIANREAVRAIKRAERYQIVEEIADMPAAEPDLQFDSDLLSRIPGLVDDLPNAARAVIRMHYLDELSLVEISEALEIPVGTVKSRLSYGLRALRERVALQARD